MSLKHQVLANIRVVDYSVGDRKAIHELLMGFSNMRIDVLMRRITIGNGRWLSGNT